MQTSKPIAILLTSPLDSIISNQQSYSLGYILSAMLEIATVFKHRPDCIPIVAMKKHNPAIINYTEIMNVSC